MTVVPVVITYNEEAKLIRNMIKYKRNLTDADLLDYYHNISGRYMITRICNIQNLMRSTAHGPQWPTYILRCRPYLACLLFSNEKA